MILATESNLLRCRCGVYTETLRDGLCKQCVVRRLLAKNATFGSVYGRNPADLFAMIPKAK